MKLRQLALFVLVGASVPAMAFIQAKPPGFEYHPEQSQEQVEVQQGETGYYNEVGIVEGDIRKPEATRKSDDPEAAQALRQANEDSKKAENALLQVEKDISGKRRGLSPVMWGFMVIAIVGLGVFALKKYADKVVPEPPKRTKPRW